MFVKMKSIAVVVALAAGLLVFVWRFHSNAALYDVFIAIVGLALVVFWWEYHKMRERRKRWPRMVFPERASIPQSDLREEREFSANFDSGMVRAFLDRIQQYIESGFGTTEIEQVCQAVVSLPHDQQRALQFDIREAGQDGSLEIRVFMDDIDAPNIYFVSRPDLVTRIKSEFQRFAKEKGI